MKKILLIWGGIALVLFIGIGGYIIYALGPGNKNVINKVTVKDVRFVLNQIELGDERIEAVINSYVSSRSFTGDHLDAFAIKISHVDVAEIAEMKDRYREKWFRGDQLARVVDDAVSFIATAQWEIPWFPEEASLKSNNFYVYPVSIHYYGTYPSAAELIFIQPSSNMIYYISLKT